MNSIKRIAIIGNAGSGKSVLAQKLHTRTKLPLYHLDKYFWQPGWQHPNLEEYKKIHDALCDKEAWIIEGMNFRCLEYRLQRAELIIFLDIPRYICIWQVIKRTWKYYGKETPSSAPGCAERFNWKFVKFLVWIWNFPNYLADRKALELLKKYADQKKIYRLKSKKEIDEFVYIIKSVNAI